MNPKFTLSDSDLSNIKTVASVPHGSNYEISITRTKMSDITDIFKERDPTRHQEYIKILQELNIDNDEEKLNALSSLINSFNENNIKEIEKENHIKESKLFKILGGGNNVLSAISSLITIISAV